MKKEKEEKRNCLEICFVLLLLFVTIIIGVCTFFMFYNLSGPQPNKINIHPEQTTLSLELAEKVIQKENKPIKLVIMPLEHNTSKIDRIEDDLDFLDYL